MNRELAIEEINRTQDKYITDLINALTDPVNQIFKSINFTSDTGTGKTIMLAKLINRLPDKFFIITSLSKGQLNAQIESSLKKNVNSEYQNNFKVFGVAQYKNNTKLTEQSLLALLPEDKDIIWVRDEGHINTNKWVDTLRSRCWKIINMSATNKENAETDIKTNFAHTMMLRTVCQQEGTPAEALDKLLDVKANHRNVPNYNPCAIMRCLDSKSTELTIEAAKERNLKYINITEDSFDMSDLCKDDNEYDVIINKFKIVEGIDIRRAHVLYMTNEPSNISTTIQLIGRCRRNALLYRNDIDIFKNQKLLKDTRTCYAFYNVKNMKVDSDEDGNLIAQFCDTISCEKLLAGSIIHVENGVLYNGLKVTELAGCTGDYKVEVDEVTGFNIVKPETGFYATETKRFEDKLTVIDSANRLHPRYCINKSIIFHQPTTTVNGYFNYGTGKFNKANCYDLSSIITSHKEIVEKNKKWNAKLKKGKVKTITIDKIYHIYLNEETKEVICNNLLIYIRGSKIRKMSHKQIELSYYYCDNELNISDTTFKEISKISESCKEKDIPNYDVAKAFIPKLTKKIEIFGSWKDAVKRQFELKKEYCYSDNVIRSIELLTKNNDITRCITTEEETIVPIEGVPIDNVNKSSFAETVETSVGQSYWLNDNYLLSEEELGSKFYYESYTKLTNDRESAIIGSDLFKLIKGETTPDCTVTSLIGKSSKFNTFIQNRYKEEIELAKINMFKHNRDFGFDKKCNSCLGYCVEYYSKYLIYGEDYFSKELEQAIRECKGSRYNKTFIVVRACLLKYLDNMKKCYGSGVGKVLRTISVQELIKDKYKIFVDTVVELGTKTANFIKPYNMNDRYKLYDPNLSINHIAGLADFINEDTIIDIKCTRSVGEKEIRQVLAYHYLSTKRSDLHIKQVILYNPIADKSIIIPITEKHQINNFTE